MTKPLDGIRVVEVAHVISGPFCGMVLGDLGADVIKIEKPGEGEFYRVSGAKTATGLSIPFPSYNRNKRGMTLNFKHPKAREVLAALIRKSDVFIENFRPGVMAELGFGYDKVKELNPRVIMASISGFGQTGPYAGKPAFDMTISAMGGFMAVNGPIGGPPMKAGPAVSDFLAGLYGALSIVAALRQRDATGEGQFIDVAMLDCVMSVLDASFAVRKLLGTEPSGTGNRRPYYAPVNVFKVRDGYVFIAASGQNHWENLASAMGRRELIEDPRFGLKDRKDHEDELEQMVQEWVSNLSVSQTIELLERSGVPCAPVKRISEVMEDPHVKARNSIVEFDYPGLGKYPVVAFPARLSGTTPEIKRAPLLGENNQEVMCGLLGYDEKEFERMNTENVF